jgi:hypothetical protein
MITTNDTLTSIIIQRKRKRFPSSSFPLSTKEKKVFEFFFAGAQASVGDDSIKLLQARKHEIKHNLHLNTRTETLVSHSAFA